MLNIEHWQNWTSTITSVHRLDSGPFAIESRARVRQPKLMPAEWRVTELDAQRGFTWVTTNPGFQITARHYAEEREPSGSSVTLSLRFDGPLGSLVGRFYRNLNERYLATEARGLKARCEG
jgi:hypothetical protein